MTTLLITGGCGYLGSQLLRDLAHQERFKDTTIRVLDNMQSENYQALMQLPAEIRYEFVEGDLLDPVVVRLALRDVDAVVHLAAIVSTPVSFTNPTWMDQVNHWGTTRLVEACLEQGTSQLVYASSAAVYGPGGPHVETDTCRPIGPYAQSKRRAERVVLAAVSRGLNPTILRFGTLYGHAPAMRFDAVANRFAYLAGIGRSLTVYGTGEQTRPFVHVADAVGAIRLALSWSRTPSPRVFNVATANYSILELVGAIHASRPDVAVRYTEQDVLTHLSFKVDHTAITRYGWLSERSLDAGMAEVIDHFRNLRPVATVPGVEIE
jgi:UDP-glucose 4-epimerase